MNMPFTCVPACPPACSVKQREEEARQAATRQAATRQAAVAAPVGQSAPSVTSQPGAAVPTQRAALKFGMAKGMSLGKVRCADEHMNRPVMNTTLAMMQVIRCSPTLLLAPCRMLPRRRLQSQWHPSLAQRTMKRRAAEEGIQPSGVRTTCTVQGRIEGSVGWIPSIKWSDLVCYLSRIEH